MSVPGPRKALLFERKYHSHEVLTSCQSCLRKGALGLSIVSEVLLLFIDCNTLLGIKMVVALWIEKSPNKIKGKI